MPWPLGRFRLFVAISMCLCAHLYGRSRQCGRPVGARCSMGLGQKPLTNGLIWHTFKLNIIFLEKFTEILLDWTKHFFLLITSHHDVLEKKKKFEKKKNGFRFSIRDPSAKPTKQKKQVALEKSLRLHTRGGPAASAELFSSKFLILSTDVPRRQSPPEIAARWRYRLPSNNLTAHYNSQFCVN